MASDDRGRFCTLRAVAVFDIALRAEGPLLVKGPEAMSPARPDMAFVRYPTPWGDAPFLPGSSLKGVLRSGCEAMLRALGKPACDPIQKKTDEPCGDGKHRRCAVCLLFGSVEGAGHLLVDDFLPWSPSDDDDSRRRRLELITRRSVVRSGVAIDRQTGAAARNRLFDYEVLVDTTFWGRLVVRNPERWQLGVVASAMELLDKGVLRVGSGTTRGLGRVRVLNPELTKRGDPELTIRGANESDVQALCAPGPFRSIAHVGLWWETTSNPGANIVRWLADQLSSQLDVIPSEVGL